VRVRGQHRSVTPPQGSLPWDPLSTVTCDILRGCRFCGVYTPLSAYGRRFGATSLSMIHLAGCLVSMDLVEVNPSLANASASEHTVDMAVGLISSALGNSII
jgi:hypothetical protein